MNVSFTASKDDFKDEGPSSFSVRVVPSFGGAFKNHLAVRMYLKYPRDYPQSHFTQIRLEVVEGSAFNEVVLSWTIDLLEKVHKLLHSSHSD